MQELYGLRSEIIEQIVKTIKKNLKIQQIILFGSRAKETYRKGSDIDISVVSENLTLKELNHIKVMLDDLMLPYKIDLIDYSRITNEELKEHIKRVGKNLLA